MNICPVCDSRTEEFLCPECGFDISRDYEHYRTLDTVPSLPKAISQLRKDDEKQGLFKCTQCGSRRFLIDNTANKLICSRCGVPIQATQVFSSLSVPVQKEITGSPEIPAAGCTVVATGSNAWNRCNIKGWTNVKAIAAGAWYTLGLRIDNTILANSDDRYGTYLNGLRQIKAVTVQNSDILALREDGTVWSTTMICNKQGKVTNWAPSWTDIQAIAAGFFHRVGLRKDGTVVAIGGNFDGQCNVEQWTQITAIACGNSHTVALHKDGTVFAIGRNSHGQCNVSKWSQIKAVAAGNCHTIGLQNDGTVVAVGGNIDGQCNVSKWTEIIAIAASGNKTVGLRKNGTVVSTDPKDAVEKWKQIVAIAVSESHIIGLQLP